MKWFLLFALLICASQANPHEKLRTNPDIQAVLEFIKEVLEAIASLAPVPPDTDLTISEYLEKYNYPLEEHNVTTEDGYILTMHRIPHGRNEDVTNTKTKPVVFLKHCLTCSSFIYIKFGPERSLALLLADAGYDVWLPNARGNHYTSHRTLTTEDDEYWDYSFHEKGVSDIPASVDYVLNYTNVDNITFVAFSEGTTEALIFASSRPEYNEKINLMVLLSPVAYMSNLTSPVPRFLAQNLDLAKMLIFDILGIKSVPPTSIFTTIGKVFCNDASSLQPLCAAILQSLVGFDEPQFNSSNFPVILSVVPDGFSVKEFIHYGQEMNSGYFRQYDFGTIGNLAKYGTLDPPNYNVDKITCHVAAYYGQNDFFAAVEDVEQLIGELPDVEPIKVSYELFNHFDFVLATDVKTLVYDMVLDKIQEYNPVNQDNKNM